MLDRIKALFNAPGVRDVPRQRKADNELHLAAAALMVEAAGLDGDFDDNERQSIRAALQDKFGLEPAAADELIGEAEAAAADSIQLYGFSRTIKDHLEPEERVKIIEMLWQVAYADGELHDYEANLVRRVAGLIYVPDQESGAARKRVLERIGDGGQPGQ
ncbi:MAG: TerB family tellurite resistance protein [Rhodospirillales bacterium]|nr:TerB family tellurite resistance protein [Rhodospirillales bacterium]